MNFCQNFRHYRDANQFAKTHGTCADNSSAISHLAATVGVPDAARCEVDVLHPYGMPMWNAVLTRRRAAHIYDVTPTVTVCYLYIYNVS